MLLTRTPRDVHDSMHNSLSVHVLSRILMIFTLSAQHVPMTQGKTLSLSLSLSMCLPESMILTSACAIASHRVQVSPTLPPFFKICPICFPCPFATYKTSYYVPSCSLLKWHLCHFSLLHSISRALRSNAQHPTCQSIRRFLLRIMSLHAGFWIAIHAIATLFLLYLLI